MILKNILAKITKDQSRDFLTDRRIIIRDKYKSIDLKSNLITVITGIRRCGKSTFLKQLMTQMKNNNYISFEDSRLTDFDLDDFENLEEIFNMQNRKYLFLDEVQFVNQWERYAVRLPARKIKAFITGSNATLLSREFGTLLTGRHLQYELFPFSYPEFLKYKKLKSGKNSFLLYLENGGFPEYLKNNNNRVLRNLFDDIIARDIIAKYAIKNKKVIKDLALYLISNAGHEFTYRSLNKLFSNGSANSVINYLKYFEECYLFFIVNAFDFSIKKSLAKPKKIYCIDNGLINTNSMSLTNDYGSMLENAVFIKLRQEGYEIFYYKGNRECDFILQKNRKAIGAVQVCYQLNKENMDREISGLKEGMDILKLNEGIIVTLDQEDKFKIDGKIIKAIPSYKYFL
jgi:predicted AAA+ superfamily ATPase